MKVKIYCKEHTVFVRNNAHTEINPMPVYTPMCDRSELSARKNAVAQLYIRPCPSISPGYACADKTKWGPQNIRLSLCAFDELVSVFSESGYRSTHVFGAITDPDALDGLRADHVCLVFSFCVYVDAACKDTSTFDLANG